MNVVDIFSEIVSATSYENKSSGGPGVFYQHGHPLEIIETLQEMTQNQDTAKNKYPLIALFQDFPERKGNTEGTQLKLNFIIAMLTFREFKAAERYAQSFNPFLIPIYELFLNKIAKSGYFRETEPSRIVHTKYDRLYWGRSGLYGNEGNIFNDYIDCIELTDLTLTLKPKNCKL